MTPDVLERERPYLLGIAYRMLGSAADAEDMVQEALVRGGAIEDARTPRALLTTIVTRLCLDELRSARRRREQYVGPWLPEPVITADGPDDQVADAESLSMGFLLLLESLTPHERAVFVLREVLDLDFDEIAGAVERTEPACRQLLHRARDKVASRRRPMPRRSQQRELAARFLGALARSDVAAMVELLAADATAVADHGGKAKAIRNTIAGPERVARYLAGLAKKGGGTGAGIVPAWINGEPAFVVSFGGRVDGVYVFETVLVDGVPRVCGIIAVRNPDKLGLPRL